MVTVVRCLNEPFTRILKCYRISTAVKPHAVLRNIVVHPKDRIGDEERSEVIYLVGIMIVFTLEKLEDHLGLE